MKRDQKKRIVNSWKQVLSISAALIMAITLFGWYPAAAVETTDEGITADEELMLPEAAETVDEAVSDAEKAEASEEQIEGNVMEDDAVVSVMSSNEDSSANEEFNMEADPDKSDAELGISDEGAKLDALYRTILIAGIDGKGPRSDVILILSLNKKNNECKVFTIARDTLMQLNDEKIYTIGDKKHDFFKCNHAFMCGDKYVMMREMNRHLDLNIREFIGVDWACAAKLVNKLNSMGYTVKGNITSKEMLKAINKLKPKEAELKSTGTVNLQGWQAVQYLRVRKYDGGGPLVRDQRNLAFFKDWFNRAKKMKLSEAVEVYETIADDLETNMSPAVLKGALALIAGAQLKTYDGWPYEKSLMKDEYSYYVPITLSSNVTNLHKKVYGGSYSPSNTVKSLNSKMESLSKNKFKWSAAIKVNNVTYNGKAQKPKLSITVGDMKLKEGTHYTVSKLKNNKNVGTASLKITGKGYFAKKQGKAFAVTKKFTVNPKGTKVSKVTKGKKSFTVKWAKQATKMKKARITGYQIQYSTVKTFKKATKTVAVKGYKKTSRKITKLKAKKKYFVRVRTYMKVGKKNYYSNWSSIKSVTTK